MPEPIVEFRSVTHRIGSRTILRSIDLQVLPGETLVLLGRSGSGKTTLLRTANRMVEPVEGEILFQKTSLLRQDPVKLRRRIGYVIQEAGLFPHFTVAANIGLVPRLDGWPADKIRERVDQLLQLMGLDADDFRNRKPSELSGGQRQRVGIARALAADPPLLLLDEPFAALDPITRWDLQRHFLQLRDTLGKTSLFVTHDIREALMLATRIALLERGSLVFLGTPAEFQRSSSAEADAFLATLGDPQ